MNTKLIGLDGKAFFGIIATTFSGVIADYNLVIGAVAATATAAYMGLRAWREWVNVKSDKSINKNAK